MRSILERLARELRTLTLRNGGKCKGDDETGWREYLSDATNILRCIREPSWAMNDAVFNARNEVLHESGERIRPELVWKTMIDAALSEEPAERREKGEEAD